MSEINLSATQCFTDAKKKLEIKDLVGFVAKITSALVLSRNDKKMLAKCTYLQAQGLFELGQHQKALEVIEEALRYNEGEEALRLKNYRGMIHGCLGELSKADRCFAEVLAETSDPIFSAEIYLNLSWIYLSRRQRLDEVKQYLNLVKASIDLLPDRLLMKAYHYYSTYYYCQSDFEKALAAIDQALHHATEEDLPRLYNDKAQIILKYDEGMGAVSITVTECLDQAEVIATKLDDKIELGHAFYIGALAELQGDQFFSALDTLNLAFEYYTEAEAHTYSLQCLLKIDELLSTYQASCVKSMQVLLGEKAWTGQV